MYNVFNIAIENILILGKIFRLKCWSGVVLRKTLTTITTILLDFLLRSTIFLIVFYFYLSMSPTVH